MKTTHKNCLIVSTLVTAWLGMQLIHETGHVLGAWATGGSVTRVHLDPLSFSRTDLADNPQPLVVAWSGPILGALIPILLWLVHSKSRLAGSFVTRFCASFCLVANGVYLGIGSFDRVGDAGDLLRHGAALWQLWLFGLLATPLGLLLWHQQGAQFGIGKDAKEPERRVVLRTVVLALLLTVIGLVVGGD